MNSSPKIILRPQPLPPIRVAGPPSPLPRLGPAIVVLTLVLAIFAALIALAANGVGLVEW